MADRISWIKNLLSLGSPAEQAAVRNVYDHALKTGKEKIILGEVEGPTIQHIGPLESLGEKNSVFWPVGHKDWLQKAGEQGREVFQAHPHPGNTPVPSLSDLDTWTNNYLVSALNKQGTYLPPDKYARTKMWITGTNTPESTLMMPSMEYSDFHSTYEKLRQLREDNTIYKTRTTGGNPHGQMAVDRFYDFTRPWMKPSEVSRDELNTTYDTLMKGMLANQYAKTAPITMDPAGGLTKFRPDLQVGDVLPEWLKYLEQKGEPIFRHGGQVPGFDNGGGVPAITILKSLPNMKGSIDWIKNLLSRYGSPAEQSAVKEVAEHGRATGQEMSVVGRRSDDPAMLLRSYGDESSVQLPKGWSQLQKDAAVAGEPVFTAHPHPGVPPIPSAGDMKGWAIDHIVKPFGIKGTYLPPDKVARENMWIAGTHGPQDHVLVPAMAHKNGPANYDLLRRIRDVDTKFDQRLVMDNTTPQFNSVSEAFWKFLPAHFDTNNLTPRDRTQLFNSLMYGEKANAYAKETPFLIDPAMQVARNIPNATAGDIIPEWMKLLSKEGIDTYRAKGGQIPGYQTGGVPAVIDPANFLSAVRSYFNAMKDIKNRPITIGVGDSILPKVLEDQRFKSQFETGFSNGMMNPARRAQYENEAFGYPLDLDPAQRPIYGHVTDRYRPDMASSYGTWGAVLKPEVKDRSSFFLGDSLFQDQPSYGPYWWNRGENVDRRVMGEPVSQEDRYRDYIREIVKNQQNKHAPLVPVDPPVASRFPNTSGVYMPGNYIEAQVHGGLPWSDVKALVRKGYSGMPAREGDIFNINQAADLGGVPAYRWRPHSDVPGGKEWFKAEPGVSGTRMIDPEMLKEFGWAEGGQIPDYGDGGYNDDSSRFSIPYGSFGLPTAPTPTFQLPVGKGQATAGFNYDMINKIIDAQLGYEHPVGKSGARLGVSGNFNKYIGEGGDQAKPDWGARIGLTLPFAGGGKVVDAIKKMITEWRHVHVPGEGMIETAVNPTYNDLLRQMKDITKANNYRDSSWAELRLLRDNEGNVHSWDAGAATHPDMGKALGMPDVPMDVNPHIQLWTKGLVDGGSPFNPETMPEWFRQGKAGGGQIPGYGEGGQKTAQAIRAALAAFDKTPKTEGYVYHATSVPRLHDIAEEGLRTHKPWEHTDQGAWPDGSVRKRAYFASSPEIASSFSPEDGPPALLRTMLRKGIERESTGDFYSHKPIKRDDLEWLDTSGAWNPLKLWGEE